MRRLGDDRDGMRGVWQDEAVVLIGFLCTSSSVSHYCVQTRGDVYSAETSKSTALGCNLVTSFPLLLPALLTSSPGPATPPAHRPIAAAKRLPSTRAIFGKTMLAEIDDFHEYCLPSGYCRVDISGNTHKGCNTAINCCVIFPLS